MEKELSGKTDWKYLSGSSFPNFFKRVYFHEPFFRAYKRLLRRVSFSGPVSIIELGSGTGYTNLRLADILPVEKITIVDNSPEMIAIAKRVLSPLKCKKDFLQEDLFDLDIRRKFDLVHSGGVVEHFNDQERRKLLSLHAELTKPGGYCIIFAPTPTKAYLLTRKIPEIIGKWPFIDERPIRKEQLVEEIEAVGLKLIDTTLFWKYHLTEVGIIEQRQPD